LLATLCFSLFFWGRFLGGTAGWLEVVLFLLGIFFVVVEVLLIPGFGVPGISGVLLIICSLVMASQNYFMPTTASEWRNTGSSLMVVMGSGIGFVCLSAFLTRYLGEVPLLSRLVLSPPEREGGPLEAARLTSTTGQGVNVELLEVGQVGTVQTSLRPAGKVEFAEEFYDVVSEGDFVATGGQVRIMEIQGNRVVVRKHQPKS
jgi:membrane-bound serine protease (ClpP class)